MSCPINNFPECFAGYWTEEEFCAFMKCRECTAEPGDVSWIPDKNGDHRENNLFKNESLDDDEWSIPF